MGNGLSFPDSVILTDALGTFLLFFILHLIFFRFVRHEHVPSRLKDFILIAFVMNLFVTIFRLKAAGWDLGPIVLCSGLSICLMVLLIMIYVLGFFGLLESSIRMRLMWEMYKVHPHALPLSELLKDYNAQTILEIRLGRLTATKEIISDGKNYYPGHQVSFFVFKEWIGQLISRVLKP